MGTSCKGGIEGFVLQVWGQVCDLEAVALSKAMLGASLGYQGQPLRAGVRGWGVATSWHRASV